MNHITTCSILLFSLFFLSTTTAEQTRCTKDDVIGRWTTYSIDIGVADHIEYQEKIDVVFLQSLDGIDQFLVIFSGVFSNAVNPWTGACIGDQYVLNGEVSSHDNVHAIQAVRNPVAPMTDQCSLERCESTCIDDLLAECSIYKSIVTGSKLTFMFLPGHAAKMDGGEVMYVAGEFGCSAHDCNHPAQFHTQGPE